MTDPNHPPFCERRRQCEVDAGGFHVGDVRTFVASGDTAAEIATTLWEDCDGTRDQQSRMRLRVISTAFVDSFTDLHLTPSQARELAKQLEDHARLLEVTDGLDVEVSARG